MRSRVPDRVLLAGLALIAAQLVFRGWFAFSNWFQFDDLVFLTRVNDASLNSDLLLEGYGGHFMPAGFALTWLFGHSGSLDYAPYAAALVAMQALASVGFLLLLRSLFGSRRALLVPLSLYLFLAISMPAFIWWAAGVNQLALQIALGWALWAHLAYLRTIRLRWAIATMLILLGCLAFYEKVLLVYGAIAILTLAYFASGSLWQRLRQVTRVYLPAVLLHVGTGVAYIAAYLHFAFNFGESSNQKVPGLELVWNVVGQALLPATVGGPLDWKVLTGAFQLTDPPGLLVVVSWVVLVALIVHLATSTDRSLRAWLFPVWFLGCGIILLGSARASSLGPQVGLEFRYITELALVVPLALALARLPIIGATESATPRPDVDSPLLLDPRRVAAATAVVCLLGSFSTWQYASHWTNEDAPRDYFRNVARTLGPPADPTPLVNTSVPEYIMWGYEYPENTTKYVLRSYADRMTFPQYALDSLFAVADDGTVQPLSIKPLHLSKPPTAECGYAVRPGDSVRVPLDSTVAASDLWARMSYNTKQDTTVTVTAGDSRHKIDLTRGLHNVYFHVGGNFTSITVAAQGDGTAPVCVYDSEVGQPFVFSDSGEEQP